MLTGMNANVACFADRFERKSGSISLVDFFRFWAEHADRFEADPPKALVAVEGCLDRPVIVELSHPHGEAQDYAFDARILFGALPEAAGPSFLIMDGGWPSGLQAAVPDASG
ncbi:hypothetical protein [Nitratireductor sp. XY-223]|uniref:hypothetical protein n=1 Tax=Nitratireductor sp. XY-223 TaxID=2561926 RepID=UPI0010AB2760|nr:hypothetical protein [Nitratireductor sp. XY-223]